MPPGVNQPFTPPGHCGVVTETSSARCGSRRCPRGQADRAGRGAAASLPLPLSLVIVAALMLSSCAVNERIPPETNTTTSSGHSRLSGTLTGIGASSQDVAQQTWIAGFQGAQPGVTINYSPEGSGAGRESFLAGGADFAGSDRPLRVAEMATGAFGRCVPGTTPFNLPVYISPIAVVFNVEGIDVLDLTPETLAGVFAGRITSWDDAAIRATNPDVDLPHLPITAVHRADRSGTTGNFTEFLHAAAGDEWPAEPSDTWPFTHGEATTQTQGVVAAVSSGVGTIGYLDASQATRLATVRIGSGGSFHPPTAAAAASLVEHSPTEPGRASGDVAIALDHSVEGYPVVLVSYLIVCSEYADSGVASLVRSFAEFVISGEGQLSAQERAGSAPMTPALRQRVLEAIATVR